jgi:hypothetical protein
MINCPSCRVPVGEVGPDGRLVAVCQKCRYTFAALRGHLNNRASRQITLQRQTTKRAGNYQREYEFRLDLPDGSRKVVPLKVPGRNDWIQVRRGDVITILYTLRGESLEEFLSITDESTGRVYLLSNPGDASRTVAKGVAGVAGAGTAILVAGQFALPFFPSAGVGALAALIVYAVAARLLAPRAKLDTAQHAELTQAQGLLTQKESIAERKALHEADYRARLQLVERLIGLQRKMEEVGTGAYAARIEIIGAAITALRRLLDVDSQLVAEYGKILTMIEIEQELIATSTALPDQSTGTLTASLEELRLIEERSAALKLEAQANDEVCKLLASG